MSDIEVKTAGFRGGLFSRFYVRRDNGGAPGWFVFGRNPAYGGHYVMLCARPNVKARAHPHYNGRVRRGWHTKAEALAVAEDMNRKDRDCLGLFLHLPLHGTMFPEGSP